MGFTFNEFPWTKNYDSDLRQILHYVRSIEAYIKTWDDVVEELRELTKEIPELVESVDRLEPLVDKLKSDMTFVLKNLDEIDDWRQITDAKLVILATRVDSMKQYTDDIANELRIDYNGKFYLLGVKINQMKIQLLALINGLVERVEYILEHLSSDVYNPIRAQRMLFDDNNADIFANLRYGGITEERFAALGLTEQELQDIGLTQAEFAYGSVIWLKDYYMFTPASGIRMSPYNALSDVLTFLCGTMTESEFEALNLTEEEFEELNLTHAEYLYYTPNGDNGRVVVNPLGNGLTEGQYQHLTVG